MAGLFPNWLSTDSVDRLNHKWMVLLILVLSLAAFIIPLHPSFHQTQQDSAPGVQQNTPQRDPSSSSIEVSCWCPSAFELSQVLFTNKKCQNSIQSAMEGKNDSGAYIVPDDIHFPGPRDRIEEFSLSRLFGKFLSKKHGQDREKKMVKSDVRSLVTYQIPLMLLVVAVVLAVPQAVWAFLSECCCPISLDPTLACAAQISGNSGSDDFNSLRETIVKSPSKSAAVMYLVKKVLSVMVVIVLLLVVNQHCLVEVQRVEKSLDNINPISTDDQTTVFENTMKASSPNALDFFKPPNDVFLCQFRMRQIANIASYIVQCTVTVNDAKEQTLVNANFATAPFSTEKDLLQLETTLLHVVTSLLAVLVVANVFSLCGWLYRLTSASARNTVHLSGHAAMDTVFLVHLARINCGPLVARRLTQEDHPESAKMKPTEM